MVVVGAYLDIIKDILIINVLSTQFNTNKIASALSLLLFFSNDEAFKNSKEEPIKCYRY